MKKASFIVLALLLVSGSVFAADKAAAKPADKATTAKAAPAKATPAKANDFLFGPGDFSAQLDGTLGLYLGGGIGADYGIGSFKIGTIPFVYGAAARVGYGFYNYALSYYSYSYNSFDVNVLGTLRVDWKEFIKNSPFFAKLESYVGVGPAAAFYSYSTKYNGVAYGTNSSAIGWGFTSIEGNNYYFNDHLALNLEEGYFGYTGAGLKIGITYKF